MFFSAANNSNADDQSVLRIEPTQLKHVLNMGSHATCMKVLGHARI
jgi:hypothetical protein